MNKITIKNQLLALLVTGVAGVIAASTTLAANVSYIVRFILLIFVAGLLAGCVTNPPPLPPGNPADPQISGDTRTPPNLLARNETTLAIAKALSQTESGTKSSNSMHHGGTHHGGMKMEAKQDGATQSHQGMQHGAAAQPEKKAVADEMKKTSDEMKATSGAMKKRSDEMTPHATIYTCPMHLEVRSDKPGNCPKCDMKLVPKKEGAHENH
jgi:Heavy metal binding domain